MDLFTLNAIIELDSDEYEKGLDDASKKANSFAGKLGNMLSNVAKVGSAAIGAATTAFAAFAKASVDTGMAFDSSMSQVAATMGMTVDEIQELRDFALEMGSTTAFSASQAADALNYMALAGYDSTQAMEALPNVLNLAAAGGIELATASDMVTDAQSALGLSFQESAELVDMMAMASSKSNTSVQQLGDAILTVGGTAKNLAGGTVELNTVLGILADNGIKGAEGGTALRNMLNSLTAPTEGASKLLNKMGVSVFDAGGNMRSLNDVFLDLKDAMDSMSQEERMNVISTIFNARDMKSAEALLANVGDRYEELSGYISDAAGAAETMANTQLDNLAGDITLFKSALEGAQIALSDRLTPTLRNFVKFGSTAISTLSTAFQEGGLSGAMDALGTILSEGLNMVIEYLPEMINAGMELLRALGQGIMDNLPMISSAAVEIISMLASFLIDSLPDIVTAGAQILVMLASGIADSLPELIPAVVQAIIVIAQTLIDNIPLLLDAAWKIVVGIAQGLMNAFPELKVFWDSLMEGFRSAWEWIQNVWNAATGFFSGIWNGIKAVFAPVANVLGQFFSSAWSNIKAIWSVVTGYFQNLWNTIKGIFSVVKSVLSGDFSSAWQAIKNVFSGWSKYFQDLWGIVKKVFSGAYNTFVNIGKNVVQGLWNGIQSLASWLYNKVFGWVSNLWNGVLGFFGIHSPSKKGEWTTEMVVRGMANGFIQNAAVAISAVQDIADGIVDVMDNMSDDISEDMIIPSTFDADIKSATAKYPSGFNNQKAGASVYDSNSYGDIIININGAEYHDLHELAEAVSNEFQRMMDRRTAVYA